ncbi:MAG: hypothetical protein WC775_05550 [Patescibacteria group bacterium]|jgi:hypothetical protein
MSETQPTPRSFAAQQYEKDVILRANPFVLTVAKIFGLNVADEMQQAQQLTDGKQDSEDNEKGHRKVFVSALAKSLELWTPNIFHAPYGHLEASNWWKSAVEVALPVAALAGGVPLLPGYLVSRALVLAVRNTKLGESVRNAIDLHNPLRKRTDKEKALTVLEKTAQNDLKTLQYELIAKQAAVRKIKLQQQIPHNNFDPQKGVLAQDLKQAQGELDALKTQLGDKKVAHEIAKLNTRDELKAQRSNANSAKKEELKRRLLQRIGVTAVDAKTG